MLNCFTFLFFVFLKKPIIFYFSLKRESHQSKHFPRKAPEWGRKPEGNPKERKETRKNGRKKRSDCGTRFDWASFSPPVLLPLYPTSPYDKESYAMDIREKAGCPEVYSFPKKYKL